MMGAVRATCAVNCTRLTGCGVSQRIWQPAAASPQALVHRRQLSLHQRVVSVRQAGDAAGWGRGRNWAQRAAAVEEAAPQVVEGEVAQQEEPMYVDEDEELVLYIKAEGFLRETAAPELQKALEGLEDVSNVKVYTYESCAFVECIKKTTVRATGVASAIVDIIQNNGFTLSTVSLGFDDLMPAEPDYFNYAATKFADDEGAQRSM